MTFVVINKQPTMETKMSKYQTVDGIDYTVDGIDYANIDYSRIDYSRIDYSMIDDRNNDLEDALDTAIDLNSLGLDFSDIKLEDL